MKITRGDNMVIHGRELSEPELKAYIKKLEELVKIKEHLVNDRNTMLIQAKHLLFKATFADRNDNIEADYLYNRIGEMIK
ncbi:MAG: hypothetical protein II249_03380 [Bacteroidaceae bacterium]|nr:hypothetical protein [Bacteroidaceae bacterium]